MSGALLSEHADGSHGESALLEARDIQEVGVRGGEYSGPLHESYMDYAALTLMHKVIRATLCPHPLFYFPGVTGVTIAVWNPVCSRITSMTKACVMTFGDICIFIC